MSKKLIFVPTAFSPNADQTNDLFRPFAAAAVSKIEYFIVFDRWGNHIYEASDFTANDNNIGWDGSYKNAAAKQGVYTYIIQVLLQNGTTKKYTGDVLLVK